MLAMAVPKLPTPITPMGCDLEEFFKAIPMQSVVVKIEQAHVFGSQIAQLIFNQRTLGMVQAYVLQLHV